VRVLVQGADALVHLAYAHVPGRYRGGEGSDLAGWLEANVHGSLNLLLAAQQAGVSTCVFLSSRAVFSRTEPGRVLDESHPTSPDTHYGAYKAAVEAFLKSFAAVGHMKTISVRATGVYGLTWPLSRSKWWDFVQAVLNDQPMATHGGGTEVHGQDVAAVIWKLLTSPGLDIDTVHLSDLYVTHHDVVRLARQFAGKPGALPPLPSSPPSHILVSRHLDTLGIALGGVPLLEKTIAQLVQAAQSNADSA
jgi:nucleoside-diphosphate-sugar epimerase